MKHYNDMNRREKRAYKRYLKKAKIWDGAVVCENLEKSGQLIIKGGKPSF